MQYNVECITSNPWLYISVGMSFEEAVSRFNSNVSYSGLLHAVTGDVSISFFLE